MIRLINRKKYSGTGRPKNKDYYSLEKSGKILCNIIGVPIDPYLLFPDIISIIGGINVEKVKGN